MQNTEHAFIDIGYRVARATKKNQVWAQQRHRRQYALMLDQEKREDWPECDRLYRIGYSEAMKQT